MFVNPIVDLLSMRAYTKLKIRTSLTGEKFTHWLPLYFGEDEIFTTETESYNHEKRQFETTKQTINTKERFEKYLTNSLSLIANGSTLKPYNHESVIEVIPKIISTHVLNLLKDNQHITINSIRRVFNFIRLWTYLSAKDEKIQSAVDLSLSKFMAKSENRIKDNCENLLLMQTYAILSDKTDFSQFMEAYCSEQLDRQALWIILAVPELDFENKAIFKKNEKKINEKERAAVTFKAGETGFRITMFFHFLK